MSLRTYTIPVLLALILLAVNGVNEGQGFEDSGIEAASHPALPIQPPNSPTDTNYSSPISEDQRITIVRNLTRNTHNTIINDPFGETAISKQEETSTPGKREVVFFVVGMLALVIIFGTIPVW